MSHSDLSDAQEIVQGGLASLPLTAHNEIRVGAANLASWLSPTGTPSSTAAIEVIVIRLPGEGWRGGGLADRLAAVRGMNCAEVVRMLSEYLDLHSDQSRSNGDAIRYGEDNRTLLTLLFTDIVGSTGLVDRLGDGAWRALLSKHNVIVRAQLAVFRGREVDHTGDGFFAVFDRPTRAVHCAQSIRGELEAVGISIRVAIHTAECETGGGYISGTAVHAAARMVAIAAPGEIIVSNTVRELVAGSGLAFSSGKWHALRGLSGRRQLFVLTQ